MAIDRCYNFPIKLAKATLLITLLFYNNARNVSRKIFLVLLNFSLVNKNYPFTESTTMPK